MGPEEGGAGLREDDGGSGKLKDGEGGEESVAIVGVDEEAEEVLRARAQGALGKV